MIGTKRAVSRFLKRHLLFLNSRRKSCTIYASLFFSLSLIKVLRMTTSSRIDYPSSSQPHLCFGIVTDVQYADVEDGTDYTKTRQRYYRNSINLLKNAINDWKRSPDAISFVLQLGDLIDGKCNKNGETGSKKALSVALHPFNSLRIPVYHLIGNHELYNLPRSFYLTSQLNSFLNLTIDTTENHLYFTFLPHSKLRIVAIDPYDVSLLGYQDNPEHENYKKAQELIAQNNPNTEVNDVTGLHGLERRWAAYNGAVSDKQLQWLSQVLDRAQSKEENVIIISHIAAHAEIKDYTACLIWNFDKVMDIVHQHTCVVAIFAGHEHSGFDFLDEHGVHHVTYQAIVETRPGGNAYATARLWDDSISVTGVGRIPSFTFNLRFPIR